jgi:hypothetical protein
MRHRALHHRVVGQTAAGTVIAVQCQQRTVVVLARAAVNATATGLERLHCDQLAARQIVNTGAEGDHFAA